MAGGGEPQYPWDATGSEAVVAAARRRDALRRWAQRAAACAAAVSVAVMFAQAEITGRRLGFGRAQAPVISHFPLVMLAMSGALALITANRAQLIQKAIGLGAVCAGSIALLSWLNDIAPAIAGPVSSVLDTAGATSGGGVAPETAMAVVLCGIAITAFTTTGRVAVICSWIGVLVVAISLVAVIGIAAHLSTYVMLGSSRMSLPSAVMLLLIGFGLAMVVPDRGMMALVAREGPAGHMVRRLLPVALIAPPLTGLAHWLADTGGRGGDDFATLVSIALTICIVVGAIASAARSLEEVDLRRRSVELEHLLQANVTQNLVEGVGVARLSDGEIVYANARLSAMLRAGQLVGRPLASLDPELEAPGQLLAQWRDAISANETWTSERQQLRHDGTRFWALITVTGSMHPLHGAVAVFVITDTSERREAAEAISRQAELLNSVLRATERHAIIGTDLEGRIIFFNTGAERMLGYQAAEVTGQLAAPLLHDQRELISRAAELGVAPGIEAVAHQALMGEPETRDWTFVRRDGSSLLVSLTTTMINGAGDLAAGLVGVATDVTEERRAQRVLHEAEERFRRSFDDALVGMQMLDLNGRFMRLNDAFCAMVGHSRDELLGAPQEAITHPDDRRSDSEALKALVAGRTSAYVQEKRYLHSSGRIVWASVSISVIRDSDGAPLHLLGQTQDITERRDHEQQLRHLADHDPLTDLANRRSFERRIDRYLRSIEQGDSGAVLMLDLDNFKYYNDTKGHRAGDQLIVRIATALSGRLRDTDLVARLGGDEFAVLLRHTDRERAESVAADLLREVQQQAPAVAAGPRRQVTASIGVALFDATTGASVDELLVRADLAMYDAKEQGRDQVAFYSFDQQGRSGLESQMRWTSAITEALAADRFELFAQPICSLHSGECQQFELLLRLRSAGGDLLLPERLLAVGERNGMVGEIDRWVVDRAITMLAQHWSADEQICFEINLSGLSIGDPELIALVERRLRETGIPPAALIFEITETAAIENMSSAVAFARHLSDLGCKFALDDFGAGYGSFYYLKHLPCDYLKIDGEFVRNCVSSETDRTLIAAVVDIARGMGKLTIAEYVEDRMTMEVLSRLGVDLAQGYALGRPAPLDEHLKRRTGAPLPS